MLDYIDKNADTILNIRGHVLDSDKKTQILNDLKNAIKDDKEFKYQSKFFYDPAILKEDSQNNPLF